GPDDARTGAAIVGRRQRRRKSVDFQAARQPRARAHLERLVMFGNLPTMTGYPGKRLAWLRTLILALAVLFGSPAWAATVTATLDSPAISLGDTVNFGIVIEGGNPDTVPPLPKIAGLQMDYAGPAQNTTIVNGRVSSSITLNYVVTPSKRGDFTIPAVAV